MTTRRELLKRSAVLAAARSVAVVAGLGIGSAALSSQADANHFGYDHSCTGWVAERLHRQAQILHDPTYDIPRGLGDAGEWYSRSRWPKHPRLALAGTVACWQGHVAYVEHLTNWPDHPAGIYISEGGWNYRPWDAGGYHEEALLLRAGADDDRVERRGVDSRGKFFGFLFPPALWRRGLLYGFRELGKPGVYAVNERRIR